MKSETALVGTDGAVELNAETAVNLNLAVVVNPGNSEHNNSLGLGNSLENTVCLVLRVLLKNRLERCENLCSRLNKLRLSGIFCFKLFKLFANV